MLVSRGGPFGALFIGIVFVRIHVGSDNGIFIMAGGRLGPGLRARCALARCWLIRGGDIGQCSLLHCGFGSSSGLGRASLRGRSLSRSCLHGCRLTSGSLHGCRRRRCRGLCCSCFARGGLFSRVSLYGGCHSNTSHAVACARAALPDHSWSPWIWPSLDFGHY